MKRYLVFTGYQYYPAGAWQDFVCDHDTIKEARKHVEETLKTTQEDWYEIVDTYTLKVIQGTHG